MEFVGVLLVYTGLIAALLAGISVIKPIRFLGVRTRAKALVHFGLGLALIALGLALPARERRLVVLRALLDEFAPVYQFHEEHSIRVRASRDQCYAAIRDVTPEEIALFRTLTWIRRLGQRGPESILNAPEHRSLIETATRTGFTMLADDHERELVVGAVMGRPGPEWALLMRSPEQFKLLKGPDIAKITMNFRVEPAESGECQVTTETRVYAFTARGRRAFAGYWRVIYPGSALIRRMWLQAIRRRADGFQQNHGVAVHIVPRISGNSAVNVPSSSLLTPVNGKIMATEGHTPPLVHCKPSGRPSRNLAAPSFSQPLLQVAVARNRE